METWNCTPDVPHTGGTFNFPSNTTSQPIVYTITYSNDDGCTAQTTYTVVSGQECHCNCSYFDVSANESFPASGGSIGSIGSWTDVCPPTVNSKPDWVTININDDHSIMASADENTSSNQRNGVVTFSYNGEICDKKMNVTQYGQTYCRTITWGGTFFNISGIEDYPVDQGGIYIGLYNMVINYAYPDCYDVSDSSITLDCVCSNYFCSNTYDSRIVDLGTTSFGDALNINRMEDIEEVFNSGGERQVRDSEDLPKITRLDTNPYMEISWGCGIKGYKYGRELKPTSVSGIDSDTIFIEFEATEPFEGTTLTAEVSLNVHERNNFISINLYGMGDLHE